MLSCSQNGSISEGRKSASGSAGLAPRFFEGLDRAYLPTFTGEEGYRLGLRMIRRLEEKRTFQAGRRDRGNVVPRRKERAQIAGIQLAGAHQAFAMPSHLP